MNPVLRSFESLLSPTHVCGPVLGQVLVDLSDFRCRDSELSVYDFRERRILKTFTVLDEMWDDDQGMFATSIQRDGRTQILCGLGGRELEVHALEADVGPVKVFNSGVDLMDGTKELDPRVTYFLKTFAIVSSPDLAIIWDGKEHLVGFDLATRSIRFRSLVERSVIRMFRLDEDRFLTSHNDGSVCIWSSGGELLMRSVIPEDEEVESIIGFDGESVTLATVNLKDVTPEDVYASWFLATVQLWKVPLAPLDRD